MINTVAKRVILGVELRPSGPGPKYFYTEQMSEFGIEANL